MNPYLILGAVLVWLASLVGVGAWQREDGGSAQQVVDQHEFDRVNLERAKQKDQADVMYRAKQAEVIATLAERDDFKNQLEKERNAHRIENDNLRARYAGLGLRFRPAEGAAAGGSCSSASGAQGNPAGTDATASVQLPDKVAADLRQLAFEADRLAGEYATCYGYANGSLTQ